MPSTPFTESGSVERVISPLAGASVRASGAVLGGALHVWAMRIADLDVERLDASVLDSEERQRAGRFHQASDSVRYVAAHLLLRQLLSRELGVAPEAIAYVRGPCPHCGEPHGRPELRQPARPLYFSLSYSGEMVLIGIAAVPIGVDLEALPEPETVSEVSALLHPAERREILAADPARRAAAFARLWTRKEAYLKGIGTGVTGDLAAEYVGTEREQPTPSGWTVIDVPVPDGYAAAAAVSGTIGVSGAVS